ncbi:MAG: hypothetical protein NZ529_08630 [Cytophagaceae bacterium]|nr:hypothetical protein [Cytophagaceae bacterium]MDW8456847.1 hypothetical protein [Cytophagaceae bacterium]
MKKRTTLLATLLALLASYPVLSQDKQAAGDKTLELQFAPLSGTPFSISGIRFRKFTSDNSAIRLTTFIGFKSKTDITQQANKNDENVNSDDDLELKDKESSFEFSIRPGYEKHFAGTSKLSPFVAGELDLGIKTTSLKEESQNIFSNDPDPTPQVYTKTTKNEGGYFRVGLNALAGFDWYFTSKLYMGGELGFGFSMIKNSAIKVTDEEAKAQAEFNNTTYEEPAPEKQGGEFNLGPVVNGRIRLGFVF